MAFSYFFSSAFQHANHEIVSLKDTQKLLVVQTFDLSRTIEIHLLGYEPGVTWFLTVSLGHVNLFLVEWFKRERHVRRCVTWNAWLAIRLPRHGVGGIWAQGSDDVVQHGDALVVDAREQHGRRDQVLLDIVLVATRRVLLPHLVLLEAALQVVAYNNLRQLHKNEKKY